MTDFYHLRIPVEVARRYSDWQECVAFRIAQVDDETVELEATNDLELLTRPEVEA